MWQLNLKKKITKTSDSLYCGQNLKYTQEKLSNKRIIVINCSVLNIESTKVTIFFAGFKKINFNNLFRKKKTKKRVTGKYTRIIVP